MIDTFDIPQIPPHATYTLITDGWSDDLKYRVDTPEGRFLLRISDIALMEQKRNEYDMLQQIDSTGFVMAQSLAIGTCAQGVYLLLTWVEGEMLEPVLPKLSYDAQYQLGIRSGQALQTIHRIPAPASQSDWETRFNAKLDRKIAQYRDCPIQFEGAEAMIAYINAHRHLLAHRPQTLQHGDYHVGNMLYTPEGDVGIIDFNRMDCADPWEEFNRIVWSATVSPLFATGQLHGYFNGTPPDAFFQLLAIYIAGNSLSSLPWAIPFGQPEVDTMLTQMQQVMGWYNGFCSYMPTWYKTDLLTTGF